MTVTAVRYDPFDPLVQDDPYPTYRRLRDHAPVYRCEHRKTWVLSRYDDVEAALLDPVTFSSAQGIFPTRKPGAAAQMLFPMMIMMDAPRHTQMRTLVGRVFTPRRIAALEDGVRTMTRELVDGASTRRSCDLTAQLAGPLPAMVIADLLGVPREDRDEFRRWSSTLVQSDPEQRESIRPGMEAAAALYGYLETFVADRRRAPREDLISALVHAQVDGQGLNDEELLGFCFLLLVAGHETTTNLLGNAAVVLAQHPDARTRLAADSSLIPAALEELLRYDSPVQGLARTLTRDVELHGQHLPAGDTVLVLFGAANRDDRAFPDPDTFDIDRRPERQVAFGRGIHFCLGASLARLEARVVLEELLRRIPDWDIDLANASRVRSGPLRGYTSLPISW